MLMRSLGILFLEQCSLSCIVEMRQQPRAHPADHRHGVRTARIADVVFFPRAEFFVTAWYHVASFQGESSPSIRTILR